MSETKGKHRAQRRQKQRTGMRVTGTYFWRAIATSQAKRDQAHDTKPEKDQPSTDTQQTTP